MQSRSKQRKHSREAARGLQGGTTRCCLQHAFSHVSQITAPPRPLPDLSPPPFLEWLMFSNRILENSSAKQQWSAVHRSYCAADCFPGAGGTQMNYPKEIRRHASPPPPSISRHKHKSRAVWQQMAPPPSPPLTPLCCHLWIKTLWWAPFFPEPVWNERSTLM